MRKQRFPILKTPGGALRFSLEVPANGVAAVQVPMGEVRDLIEAECQRDAELALAEAKARLSAAVDEVVRLEPHGRTHFDP